VPPIQAVVGLTASTVKSTVDALTPAFCAVQCAPPSVVCRSVADQPTAHPFCASAKDTLFKRSGGSACSVQLWPPFVVLWIRPPTAQPVVASTKSAPSTRAAVGATFVQESPPSTVRIQRAGPWGMLPNAIAVVGPSASTAWK
jgi:hypothetical protein